MDGVSMMQSSYRPQAPAPTPTTEAKNYPSVDYAGEKDTVVPGKEYTFRAITNAKGPATYKWAISLDGDAKTITGDTFTFKSKGKSISLNVILTITDADGNSNEKTWTLKVRGGKEAD